MAGRGHVVWVVANRNRPCWRATGEDVAAGGCVVLSWTTPHSLGNAVLPLRLFQIHHSLGKHCQLTHRCANGSPRQYLQVVHQQQ